MMLTLSLTVNIRIVYQGAVACASTLPSGVRPYLSRAHPLSPELLDDSVAVLQARSGTPTYSAHPLLPTAHIRQV
jgi:hypothetical protein